MGIREIVEGNVALGERLAKLRAFGHLIRNSEYHVTNACNIRCKGCWFFAYDFDQTTSDLKSLDGWREFIARERDRGVTSALLIGGEPTLYPDRVAAFVEGMAYVTLSSNGLQRLPRQGFENVAIGLTLFGGGRHDDAMRAIKPNGKTFEGLFDTVLENYENDDRVVFIYALTDDGCEEIEPTIRRIRDNGNQVCLNYYSQYGSSDPLGGAEERSRDVLEEALRVQEEYPDTLICDPYYIRTLLTGRTDWGTFGYDTCPSISVDHPAHKDRLKNGNRVLPLFNSYAADTKTVNFCCTSGHCDGCRDSQAVYSWLLVSVEHFVDSPESLSTWLNMAENYWRQWVWSPYHPRAKRQAAEQREAALSA